MNAKELVCLAARYADEKKAENIKLIDLGGLSSLCDYVLIATATSKPHLDAVEEEISTQLKKLGYYKSNRDGGDSNLWRVSDYGAFLVHIMTQEARDFYALDKIFSFGKETDYKTPKPAAKKTAQKAAPKAEAKTASKTVKKATAKKPAAPKTAVKKTSVKKVAPKAAATKKTAAKPAVKKTAAKTVKKTAAKKSTAKKAVKKTAKK